MILEVPLYNSHNNIKEVLKFDEATSTYTYKTDSFINNFSKFLINKIDNIKDISNKNILDLTSSTNKLCFIYSASLWHTIVDSLMILYNIKDFLFNYNVEVIFEDSDSTFFEYSKKGMKNFLKLFCEKNNIKYTFVDLKQYDGFTINNYIFLSDNKQKFFSEKNIKNISEWFRNEYIQDAKPNKKVYLSRLKTRSGHFMLKDGESSNFYSYDKPRITNEVLLESFFKENGFEIIYPEDFDNIEDQISFMRNVKTIASLTSSGLANMFFMNTQSTIIELMTSFPGNIDYESLHNQYSGVSYMLGNNHYIIPNNDRFSETLIERIRISKILETV